MSTEQLLQKTAFPTEIPMEILTPKDLSKTEKIAMNNRRWIELSQKCLQNAKNKKKMQIGRVAVASIAIPAFATMLTSFGYYFYTSNFVGIAAYSFAASVTCCSCYSVGALCVGVDLYEEKRSRLDPSQTKNVTEIFNEILNGNIENNSRIKEFGILSEKVYGKFESLANEKKRIENDYLQGVKSHAENKLNMLVTENNTYIEKMDLWNKNWNEFKPELEADLPDLKLLNQYSYDIKEIISV